MAELSLEVRTGIRALFAPGDVREAERLLTSSLAAAELALPPGSADLLERLRCAAVRVSDGGLPELVEAIALARKDWRDLLVAAGFADDVDAHRKWALGAGKMG